MKKHKNNKCKGNERMTKSGKLVNSLKCFFIPHDDNNHKPIIIRPTALKIYSIILIITKIFVTGFLFLAYPSPAHFGNVTSSSVVDLTNSSRRESGLPELKTSTALNMAAYQKAQDMVKNNYFSHESPSGSPFWNWILNTGYQYTTAGENLAMDFTSAQSVQQAFMASASHRNNILNPNFTEIGISVISGEINNRNTMILVAFFGAPKITSAPKTVTAPIEEIPPAPAKPEQETPPSEITKTEQPKTVTPAPQPFFKAEVAQMASNGINLKPEEQTTFWVDIKNTGNVTWTNDGNNFVALNVTDPSGRESSFYQTSWLETYRPAKLVKDKVSPGETTRVEFVLKAPTKPGEYQEAFQLVAENLTWIESSHFAIPITVLEEEIKNVNIAAKTETNQNVNQNQNENTNSNVNKKEEINVVTVTNTNEQIISEVKEQPLPIVIAREETKSSSFTDYLIDYSQKVFWFLLIFITVSLLINIFVKIRIQHFNTIISTLLVILMATLMIVSKFHFIENIISSPTIL